MYRMLASIRFLLLTALCLSSSATVYTQVALTPKQLSTLGALVESSTTFQKGFTGFALFDPVAQKFLYTYQANKYFTPASNAKILTFFAAETMLNGQMPLLHYQDFGDTLKMWGTGYPLLLHPYFADMDTLGNWLRARHDSVWYIADDHYQDGRFGEGWSWDDYPYGYQMEKAALPVYGNGVHFSKRGHLAPMVLTPARFQEKLVYDSRVATLGREEDRNIFTFGKRALSAQKLDRSLPFLYSLPLAIELLRDTFRQQIWPIASALPPAVDRQTLMAPLPDSLYRLLLHDSDNYTAEQLILMCSARRYGILNTEQTLAYLRDTVLAHLPQPVDWVDGSGLSRYNQVTPTALVLVLNQLQQRIPQARLFDLFPAGGQSGTIQQWYKGKGGKPFVYAKTGTLRHVHCLSGYLVNADGKVLIFSFMHNNFPAPVSDLKREMAKVLGWIHEEVK